MTRNSTLSPSMTLAEFDNGYWYAVDLKRFATAIGIRSAGALRKDELERAIKAFLAAGRVARTTTRRAPALSARDDERGLRLSLRVANYINNKITKDFLEREARRASPDYKRKSGARYRLNRWREAQLASAASITYGDVVAEYVRLSRTDGAFAQIPTGRYINFVSDYYAAERDAKRADVLRAWKALKRLNVPKTYQSWVKASRRSR